MRMFCCVFLFFFLCAGGYARKNTPAGQIFWTKPFQYNYLFLLSGYFKNTIYPTHPPHSLSHL